MTKTSALKSGGFYRYAALLIWIAFIFFLSSGQASAAQTSRFIRPLLDLFLSSLALPETIDLIHAGIRKLAHLFIYAVAGILAIRAFRGSMPQPTTVQTLSALSLVLLVATIDEINQSFDPTRTGSPFDVAIDLAGGIIGVAGVLLMSRLRPKRFGTA